MATLLPNGEQQFCDANGKPYAGGKVYFYIPNTTTFKNTWQDAGQTTLNTNPVVLDGAGRAVIYGSGQYRQQLYDVNNNLVWDQLTSDLTSGLTAASITWDSTTLANYLTNNTANVVTNVAALRALSHLTYTFAATRGYYAAGDNGQGFYYYDPNDTTSGDNGGTIIVASDGARWKLIYDIAPTVRQFGAKGDGTTDDTARIQAAINTISVGGSLYFPKGTYYIATGLVFGWGLSLIGLEQAILLGPTSGTTTMLATPPVGTGVFYTTHIRNLEFSVRSNYIALTLGNASSPDERYIMDTVIENCVFTSVTNTSAVAAYLVFLSDVIDVRMTNCSFYGATLNGLNGINNGLQLSGVSNCVFNSCNFAYMNIAILQGSQGGQISQGNRFIACTTNGCITTISSANTNSVMFSGGLFDNHKGPAVISSNDLEISFVDCYFGSGYNGADNLQFTVTAGSVNSAAQIVGCTFAQYVSTVHSMIIMNGLSGTYYNDGLISGCTFSNGNNLGYFVATAYAANTQITGCVFIASPTAVPVSMGNPPIGTPGTRVSASPGVSPWGPITTGSYGPPTALTSVGSGNLYASPYPFDCMVYISSGTITSCTITGSTRSAAIGAQTAILVPQGSQIACGFSGSPTWQWFGL